MQNSDFPNNLIRDLYNDIESIDDKIQQIHTPSLLATLAYLSENERNGILRRYQDGLTFRKVGETIGQQSTIAQQTVKRGVKRLRRFGDHHYFHIDPRTGTAYTPDIPNRYIGELRLHSGAETALTRAGYHTIESVRALSEAQLKALPKFGERYFADFAEKIAQYEIDNGLTSYAQANYPDNLMQAIYGEEYDAAAEDIQAVEQALKSLNRQQQTLILMKYKEQRSITEISQKIQLSVNRTSQTIKRGLEKIKQLIQPEYYVATGHHTKRESKSHAELLDMYPFNLIGQIMGTGEAYLRTAYLEGFHQEIERLPDTYRTFVRLRYELGLTLTTCGNRMNKRPYDIELIERQLVQKLRAKKQEGRLTAISKHDLLAVQQQSRTIMTENQRLKDLLEQVHMGVITPEDIPLPNPKTETTQHSELINIPIENLKISVRAYNILARNQWNTLKDITQHTRKQFTALRHVGQKVEQEIDDMLARYNLSFKDETPSI